MANTNMPNGTQYHAWKPEPLVRGTFSILSSSLLTMILCVWTAVHLNIPEPGGARAQMWRRTGWMVVALFAPEWVSLITLPHGWPMLTESKVVFTAYCEHAAANDIGETMRKAFDQPEPPGFVENLKNTKLLERLKTLEPLELLRDVGRFLGKLGHFISRCYLRLCFEMDFINEDTYLRRMPTRAAKHIDAESALKSGRHTWKQAHSLYSTMGGFVVDTRGTSLNYLPDGRQRMTLTLQGLTFIAEKAPDLLPDLPESAIVDKSKANAFTKLVTCGQAVWFCVQCATRSAQGLSISLLEINTAVHAICTLIMYYHFWWHKPLDIEEPTILTHADTHSIIAFLVITRKYQSVKVSPIDMEDDGYFEMAPDSGEVITHPVWSCIQYKRSKDTRFPITDYVVYHGFVFSRSKNHPDPCPGLTKEDFECFKLASKSARKYKLQIPPGLYVTDYLKVRLRNRPTLDSDTDAEYYSTLVGFPLAGLFYGSVHLLVWNRPFRGETDELLWKTSSLIILLSGIPLIVWLYSSSHETWTWRYPRLVTYVCKAIAWSFYLCFPLFYIFCRTYIIVECFLDVFYLPDSAFEVPQWSQYFPHIG